MNSQPRFDIAVLIGRFQPFHKGHLGLLGQALATAERAIVVIGSAHQARSVRNPFTWQERAAMIAAALDEAAAKRVSFAPVRDYYDDTRWSDAVDRAVRAQCGDGGNNIALIGFHKDASSYYLKLFPHWTFVATPQYGEINATRIRQAYFSGENPAAALAQLADALPAAVAGYLQDWARLPEYAAMRDEHRQVEESRKKWGSGPFVTVDAVVTCAGHVLLVRRGHAPGMGLWALPGGFLEGRERLLQGAMRELREETGLPVADADLQELLRGSAVFDHPERSVRGRTITHAHWFDLGECRLPDVAGADDAAEARWVPLRDLPAMEESLFEDHFHILDHFLSLTV